MAGNHPTDLERLFPIEPDESPTAYRDRLEALTGAMADAVEAYRLELGWLTAYAPDGPWRKKLESFVEGRLPFAALPAGLRDDLQGRLRCTFVAFGEEATQDGSEPTPFLRIVGDQIEGMDAAVRTHKLGLPARRYIEEDETTLRERLTSFLHARSIPASVAIRKNPRSLASWATSPTSGAAPWV